MRESGKVRKIETGTVDYKRKKRKGEPRIENERKRGYRGKKKKTGKHRKGKEGGTITKKSVIEDKDKRVGGVQDYERTTFWIVSSKRHTGKLPDLFFISRISS